MVRSFLLFLTILVFGLAFSGGVFADTTDDGFVPLFDGKTFKGWYAADMSWWSIQDGAITGTITAEKPCKKNQYIFYEPHLSDDKDLPLFGTKGLMGDFELKITHRITSPHRVNGGFQYRSEHYMDGDCKGYQIDNNTMTPWLARMYDEFGRHTLAWRGERTRIDEAGNRNVERIASVPEKAHFSLDQWHQYHLICRGTQMTLYIDGKLVAEVFDGQPSAADLSGLLAPQLHSGPPMVVQFKDILYKQLTKSDWPTATSVAAPAPKPDVKKPALTDKTLVAWVCPSTLSQKGGSVLTVQSGPEFDGIVFAEIMPAKWMVGSHFYQRTNREQKDYPAVRLTDGECYQMAIVYQGDRITLYKDGEPIDSYARKNINILGKPDLLIVFGKRHHGQNGNDFFQGAIDDARVYPKALSPAQLKSLTPNEPTPGLDPTVWFDFAGDKITDRAGALKGIAAVGQPKLVGGKLVLSDRAFFYAARTQANLKGMVPPPPGQPFDISRIDSYDWPTMPEDPPAAWSVYHLAHPGPGIGMPGDPNCAFFWKGRYHLHYIYRNAEGYAFAHVSSTDMVHWQWHPTTLTPSFTGHGMFSGTAFMTKEGEPAIIYHGQGSGRNVIHSPLDDHIQRWARPKPVVPRAADGSVPEMRHWDPDCWLNGDMYYALSGGKNPQLMKSKDLKNWTHLGDVLHEDFPSDLGVEKGEDISCANMFKIGDKWMLLCISHRLGCRYYLGDFKDEKFLPDFHAMMNWKGWQFFAPESLLTPDGRRVMWAWCKLDQPGMRTAIQSLPRELSLPEDGVLRIKPLRELESLRFDEKTESDLTVSDGNPLLLKQIAGDVLELEVKVAPNDATKFGLTVFGDKENQAGLPISVIPGERILQVGDVRAPFELKENEMTTFRVFLDKAIVEVFVNDRQAVVTAQTHPAENIGIALFAEGADMKVPSLTAWKMKTPITADNCKVKLED